MWHKAYYNIYALAHTTEVCCGRGQHLVEMFFCVILCITNGWESNLMCEGLKTNGDTVNASINSSVI